MAVITVITKDPGQFNFQALMHGITVDYLGKNTFEVIGDLAKAETLAALTRSTIINSVDIKC
jgi:hypothetical protein